MKKFVLVSLICFVFMCCTGCVKISYNIEIDNNDEISISETQALNLEPFKAMDKNAEKELKKDFDKAAEEYKSKGYNVKEYKDDVYTGLTISKDKIKFADAVNSLPKGLKNESDKFTMKTGLIKNTYKIHLITDKEKIMSSMSDNDKEQAFSNQPQAQDGFDEPDFNEPKAISTSKETDPVTGEIVETSKLSDGSVKTKRINEKTGEVSEVINYADGGYSKTTYNQKDQQQFGEAVGGAIGAMPGVAPVADLTIKIPVKAKSHNAAKVISDTEYQWNLFTEGDSVEVNIEYEKYNIGWIVLLSAGLLGIIILLIIKMNSGNPPKVKRSSGIINGF